MIAGGLYLRYGKYMAVASAALFTANNLKLEEELDKNLGKNSKVLEEKLHKNLEST